MIRIHFCVSYPRFSISILPVFYSEISMESFVRKLIVTRPNQSFVNFSVLNPKRNDLMSMLGVLVVLGVGIIVALLALFTEFMWKRKERKINSKGGSVRFAIFFLD